MSGHDLTPEEEAQVRRLLADSAEPVPLPEEVAARLDDVLAGLVAERDQPSAPVVPIGRRRWPKVLVAAAAVSLLGYTGSSLLAEQSPSDHGPTTAAHDGAGGSESAGGESRGEPQADTSATKADRRSAPRSASPQAELDRSGDDALAQGQPLGPGLVDTFRVDLTPTGGVLDSRKLDTGPAYGASEQQGGASGGRCARPAAGEAVTTFELSAGKNRRFVVVVRPLSGSAARADVYLCRLSVFPVASTVVLDAR